jgi:N-methylhydantoinase A/oxoprolinase/acetone carboxylase beta subunit
MQRAFMAGAWREVPAYERSALAAGAGFPGPALVVEDHTATVVDAGWTCSVDQAAALVLRRQPSGSPGPYT